MDSDFLLLISSPVGMSAPYANDMLHFCRVISHNLLVVLDVLSFMVLSRVNK